MAFNVLFILSAFQLGQGNQKQIQMNQLIKWTVAALTLLLFGFLFIASSIILGVSLCQLTALALGYDSVLDLSIIVIKGLLIFSTLVFLALAEWMRFNAYYNTIIPESSAHISPEEMNLRYKLKVRLRNTKWWQYAERRKAENWFKTELRKSKLIQP